MYHASNYDMVTAPNKRPQCRSQYTVIIILGTPQKRLDFWKPACSRRAEEAEATDAEEALTPQHARMSLSPVPSKGFNGFPPDGSTSDQRPPNCLQTRFLPPTDVQTELTPLRLRPGRAGFKI